MHDVPVLVKALILQGVTITTKVKKILK